MSVRMPQNPPKYVGREDEDVSNVVFAARIRKGKTRMLKPRLISRRWVTKVEPEPKEQRNEPEPMPLEKRDKIHPVLREWLDTKAKDERHEIMLVFRENMIIPRFPEPKDDEPRDSDTNRKLLQRADELVKEITARREESYRAIMPQMEKLEAKVLDTFWLINAMLAEMPLGAVPRIAEMELVDSIEPRYSGEKPPQDEVDDARSLLQSDPYFNLGQTSGWIGLLDTGVRTSHTLFTNPSHLSIMGDCVNGGTNCDGGSGFNTDDDCWNHGTSTAAIITGNDTLGNDFRGVTGITLDSFKVYPSGCVGLDSNAVVRAFQRAVNVLDRVIVAEMQSGGDDISAISQAADAAYNAGAVVIAANGNNGPNASTVNAPANAHRAIGVGNFDVQTGAQVNSQSRGPTRDSRFKPDIQAPTNTQTASNATNTATQIFSGTSGATPYGASCAALLRNWLRGNSGSIDPGQVYAQMIVSGQQPYPFNNTSGAGKLALPINGVAWWGKVEVHNGDNIDIPISLGRNIRVLDAALWWPEYVISIPLMMIDPHSDIDLHLVDPNGTTCAWSISVNSVFERAQVAESPLMAGTWKLRIRGYNVVSTSQPVYWTAVALL